jgi:hypothetical protein
MFLLIDEADLIAVFGGLVGFPKAEKGVQNLCTEDDDLWQ